MSFSVGIVGLPNVGKSTLFKALTQQDVDIADYPFTTLKPNYGIVSVPDARLEKIAKLIKPEKVTPTIIQFVDIAGLVKGAYQGAGLGNQFLAQIRNCDAILDVIRGFENPQVENVLGEINPEKEAEIIKTELLMKDLETLTGLIRKIEKDIKKNKKSLKRFELLKRIREKVSQGKLISEINLNDDEILQIKEYQFLTAKPIILVTNIGKDTEQKFLNNLEKYSLFLNFKEEEEISQLSEEEKKELKVISKLDQLIKKCYHTLDLITFFTIAGGKETRAWTLKKGQTALRAAGLVHSDFEEKFIRAEVIDWKKLVEIGSWKKAKEKGLTQLVGKDYLVQDGDVIEFKI